MGVDAAASAWSKLETVGVGCWSTTGREIAVRARELEAARARPVADYRGDARPDTRAHDGFPCCCTAVRKMG